LSSTFFIFFILMRDPGIFVAYMAHLYIYIRESYFFWGGVLPIY
jgi:hypothetical protein